MAARRKRRSRGRGTSKGVIFSIAVLIAVIVLALSGYGILMMRARSAPTLEADLCPETGASSATVVLLDVTDPIAEITKLDLKRGFQRIVDQVEQHGLIEVYFLTGVEGNLERTFHGCNPGSGDNADPWTSNPKKIQQRWENAFSKPLQNIENKMGDSSSSKQSPIMAGVQRIVLETFADPRLDDKPKRLIVASDMMEFTPAFSMYKSGADLKAFEASSARDKFRTPLDNINVSLMFFQRAGVNSIKGLPDFWAGWITANRGQVENIERLTGTM